MNRVVFARGDDWEGLYLDGILVEEGHSIQPEEALRKILSHYPVNESFLQSNDVVVIDIDLDWIESQGSLPSVLSDVKMG